MSSEVVVLALSTVIRPTTAAAVLALVSARGPQRLLAAYVAAGLAFSLTVGALVVMLLQGIDGPGDDGVRRPVVQLAAGLLTMGYAAAVGLGLVPPHRPVEGAPARTDGIHGRLQHLSMRDAVAAGVLTHLPGLVYLAALHAIATSASGALDAFVQVAVYNAIWFSLAIVALLLSVHRPAAVRDAVEQLGSRIRRHGRTVIVVGATALGGYLVVVGVLGLLRHPG